MTDNSLLFVALCGAGAIFSLVLLMMLVIILRVTGRNVGTFFSYFWGSFVSDRAEHEPLHVPRQIIDVHALAASVDFDEALAVAEEQAELQGDTQPDPATKPGDLPPSVFDVPGTVGWRDPTQEGIEGGEERRGY